MEISGEAAAAAAEGGTAVEAAAEAAEEEQQEQRPASAPISTPAPERPPPLEEYLEMHVPDSNFLCPISLSLMDDPVLLVGDGWTYSKAAIQQHLDFCRDSALAWRCMCGWHGRGWG